MAVEIGGREIGLRGRQARLVVAYLAWNRARPVSRDELIELLWPREAPASPDDVLTALLSKIRARARARARSRAGASSRSRCRTTPGSTSRPPTPTSSAPRPPSSASDWAEACRAGHDVLDVTAAPFLLAHDHPWVEQRRRELEELRLRTLERVGSAGARARRLGHRRRRAVGARDRRRRRRSARAATVLLMEALAARGDVAEALRAYEDLRVRLRDELGAIPGAAVRALHERLLERRAAGARRAGARRAQARHRRGARLRRARAGARGARAARGQRRCPDDDVVGVFGVPRAHEDDAERAVARRARLGGRAAVATRRRARPRRRARRRRARPGARRCSRATPRRRRARRRADRPPHRSTPSSYERAAAAFETRTLAHRPARPAHLVRRPRARAVAAGGRPPDGAGGGAPAAGRGRRRRRRRQVAAVEEFLRRARESRPRGRRAHRPLPGLRRRPHLLAAARAAVVGRRHPARTTAPRWPARSCARLVERVSAEPERTVSALAVTAGISCPATRSSSLEPESVAAEVALAWPRLASRPRRARRAPSWWSRTCTGPSRRCSTCSSSSWRARPGRCSSSSPRGPSCSRRAPAGAAGARRRSSRSSR